MIRSNARTRILAASIAAVAGFVDALGFLELKGYFVSFMSGNSTRLAVGLGSASAVVIPAMLLTSFVIGVVLGEVAGSRRYPDRIRTALLVSMTFLIAASITGVFQHDLSMLFAAMAMGAVNVVFSEEDRLTVGLTYMTGTLVAFGRHLGQKLMKSSVARPMPYFLHWCALIAGGIVGTLIQHQIGVYGLWIAVCWLALIATIVRSQRVAP